MKKYIVLYLIVCFFFLSVHAQGSYNYSYRYTTTSQYYSNKAALRKALAKKKAAKAKKMKKDSTTAVRNKSTSMMWPIRRPKVNSVGMDGDVMERLFAYRNKYFNLS